MAHMTEIFLEIPGGTPDQIAHGHRVGVEFFKAQGIDPEAAAIACFARQSFHEFNLKEYEGYDEVAAEAWDAVTFEICKACEVKECFVSLARVVQQRSA